MPDTLDTQGSRRSHHRAAALIFACLPTTQAAGDEVAPFHLGEIVVSGTREAEPYGAEERVDAAAMRAADRFTVGTALDLLPGVNVSRVGARNEEMAYVRGFDLRQVPVYLDGIPVYVPYDGYVDLGRFTTFDLANVTVSKGLSSLVYGANTLGGAINLVSRKPTKAFEGDIGAALGFTDGGWRNAYQTYLNAGTSHDHWYGQLGVSYSDRDFFPLPGGFVPTPGENGGRRDNSYQNDRKVSFKLGYTPNESDEYSFGYVNQHGVKGTPPYAGTVPGITPRYWQWPYWDKESFYALSSTAIGAHTLKLRAYHDIYQNSLFAFDDRTYTTQVKRSSFQSWYDDYTNGGALEFDAAVHKTNTLKLAYNVKQDVHREHNLGEPIRHFEDITHSIAIEDGQKIGNALNLVAGVSYDLRQGEQAQDFNSAKRRVSDFPLADQDGLNGQVGAFYLLNDTARLHASFAHKTRFGTIKDRYSYRLGTAIPNPDLKTEEADHFDFGYDDSWGKALQWSASIFHIETSNLIQSVLIAPTECSAPPCSQMQNVGHVTTNGAEISVEAHASKIDAGFNYTFLHRHNDDSDTVKLTDTPDHDLFAHVTWRPLDPWHVTANVELASQRYSSSDGRQIASGFAVANLKTGWQFSHGIEVEAGVENLFDRLYAYSEGFPEPGRTLMLQARVTF